MKKLICIIITILTLSAIIAPCCFAAEPTLKEQSFLAYYKFLEDELASMGNICKDEYFYRTMSARNYLDESDYSWYNDKIAYVYLYDVTGDGIEDLIYSKIISHGELNQQWVCIYSYINGQLTRIAQTGDVQIYNESTKSYSYAQPDGFIGYMYSDLYLCVGAGGSISITNKPAEMYGEETNIYYSFTGGSFKPTTKLYKIYIEWYKTHNLTSRYGYSINDNHANETQFSQMINSLQGAGITKLVPNDYNSAMWLCGEVSKNYRYPSSWAASSVNSAIEKNYVPRSLQDSYTNPITRAEFCELSTKYYEAITGKEIESRTHFNDTTNPSVEKMGSLGVISGVGNGNFAPNDLLTREQAAAILTNLSYALKNPIPDSTPDFADAQSISAWASQKVGAVQSKGIMGGVGNGNFDPKGKYTREQSILTILRMEDIKPNIRALSFTKPEVEIYAGITMTFPPVVDSEDTANKTLRWSSSNTNVATVDENSGAVTSVAGGKTTISVTAAGGASASFDLTVIEAVGPIWTRKLPVTVRILEDDEPEKDWGSVTITEIIPSAVSGAYNITAHLKTPPKEFSFDTYVKWTIEDYYGNVVDSGKEDLTVFPNYSKGEDLSFSIISVKVKKGENYIIKFE